MRVMVIVSLPNSPSLPSPVTVMPFAVQRDRRLPARKGKRERKENASADYPPTARRP